MQVVIYFLLQLGSSRIANGMAKVMHNGLTCGTTYSVRADSSTENSIQEGSFIASDINTDSCRST